MKKLSLLLFLFLSCYVWAQYQPPTLSGGGDVVRGAICLTAGCGSETSMGGIMMFGSGTITTCGLNLLTAPTGSSVIVNILQNGSVVSSATMTVTVGNKKTKLTGLSIPYADQDIFTAQIQPSPNGNDSGNSAQGGTYQCR